jgi:hypothetical protein
VTRCEPPYHQLDCSGCYDADAFDAELAVERTGHAFFDRDLLAEITGLSPRSFSRMQLRGTIPAPDHYGHNGRAIWTPEQVVQILADRKGLDVR